MLLAHLCFRLPVQMVRPDAAYFTRPILTYILSVLNATPKVIFNARKAGKKFLVTLAWVAQARAAKASVATLNASLPCLNVISVLTSFAPRAWLWLIVMPLKSASLFC